MQRLRFLHIPKCAGITFVTMLRLQYLGRAHFSFSGELAVDRRQFAELTPERQARIRLFTGHAPIETGIPEVDRDTAIVTMLREPVGRVKSLCQHVYEGKSPHLRERFPSDRFDLDDFLSSGYEGLSNLQTRMLINKGKAAAGDLLNSMSGDEAAVMALRNLHEKTAAYGISEYFDESLVHLQQKFGWRTPCYTSINTKNPSSLLVFEDRHLARIAEANAVDMAVYEAAKRRFLELIESPDFDRTNLARLRTMQIVASPAIRALILAKGLLARGTRSPTGR